MQVNKTIIPINNKTLAKSKNGFLLIYGTSLFIIILVYPFYIFVIVASFIIFVNNVAQGTVLCAIQ